MWALCFISLCVLNGILPCVFNVRISITNVKIDHVKYEMESKSTKPTLCWSFTRSLSCSLQNKSFDTLYSIVITLSLLFQEWPKVKRTSFQFLCGSYKNLINLMAWTFIRIRPRSNYTHTTTTHRKRSNLNESDCHFKLTFELERYTLLTANLSVPKPSLPGLMEAKNLTLLSQSYKKVCKPPFMNIYIW